MKSLIPIFLTLVFSTPLWGKLNIVTTTTTLKSVAKAVGGDLVEVTSITKGPQDPHFVEARPSYMVIVRSAHLVISVGLDLEIGWLGNILRGSRNPKVLQGRSGHLDVSTFIKPIEVMETKVDRSMGDIHPKGNPHFTLDPLRVVKIARGIEQKFSQLDEKNAGYFKQRADQFARKIEGQQDIWSERIKKSGVKELVTYHRTLGYFLERFNLQLVGEIEPKPGIPPTAKHIIGLIGKLKERGGGCILVESFFETTPARRINKSVPVHIETIPTEVESTRGARDYQSLIEEIVLAIERCSKGPKKHGQ